MIIGWVNSAIRGPRVGSNPWKSKSLEWTHTEVVAGPGNFPHPVVVDEQWTPYEYSRRDGTPYSDDNGGETASSATMEETTAAAPAPLANVSTGASGEDEPLFLSAARGGQADDLKRIKGVGPKLEDTLNSLGIYHFDQIAKWNADNIDEVNERLKFSGRIERDDWVNQAKLLAEGEETEFSKRVDKGQVPSSKD
jgi:NADH-quinone oxidoreductase subunit E